MRVVITFGRKDTTQHITELYIDKDVFEFCPESKRPSVDSRDDELKKIARLLVIADTDSQKSQSRTTPRLLKRVTWVRDKMTAVVADKTGVMTVVVESKNQGTPEIYYNVDHTHPHLDMTEWAKNGTLEKITSVINDLKMNLFLDGAYMTPSFPVEISAEKQPEHIKLDPTFSQVSLAFPLVREISGKFAKAQKIYNYRRERFIAYQEMVQKGHLSAEQYGEAGVKLAQCLFGPTEEKILSYLDIIKHDQILTGKLRDEYQKEIRVALQDWYQVESLVNLVRYYFAAAVHNTLKNFIDLIYKNSVTRQVREQAILVMNDFLAKERLSIDPCGIPPSADSLYENFCRHAGLGHIEKLINQLFNQSVLKKDDPVCGRFFNDMAQHFAMQLANVAMVLGQVIRFDKTVLTIELIPQNSKVTRLAPFECQNGQIIWSEDATAVLKQHQAYSERIQSASRLSAALSPPLYEAALDKEAFLEEELGDVSVKVQATSAILGDFATVLEVRQKLKERERAIAATRSDRIKVKKTLNDLITKTEKLLAPSSDTDLSRLKDSITQQLKKPTLSSPINKGDLLALRELARTKLDEAIEATNTNPDTVAQHVREADRNFDLYGKHLTAVETYETHLLNLLKENTRILDCYAAVVRFRRKIAVADNNILRKETEIKSKYEIYRSRLQQLPPAIQTEITLGLNEGCLDPTQIFATKSVTVGDFSAEVNAISIQSLTDNPAKESYLETLGVTPSESSRYAEEYLRPIQHYGKKLDNVLEKLTQVEEELNNAEEKHRHDRLEERMSAVLIAREERPEESSDTPQIPLGDEDSTSESDDEQVSLPVAEPSSSFWQRHRGKILATAITVTLLGAGLGAAGGFFGLIGIGMPIGAGIGAGIGFVFGLLKGLVIAGIAECCRQKPQQNRTELAASALEPVDTKRQPSSTAQLERNLRTVHGSRSVVDKSREPIEFKDVSDDYNGKDPVAIGLPATVEPSQASTLRHRKT